MFSILNPLSWFPANLKENQYKIENKNEGELVEIIKFDTKLLKLFIKLLSDDCVIKDFFHFDTCNVLADKYLIAITFAYFIRADLKPDEYTRLNFFSALYLAHAMEEDEEDIRDLIIPWSDGKTYRVKKNLLLDNYVKLWHKMDHRTLVSKTSCEKVIQTMPHAKVWHRFRPEIHSGASRSIKKCFRCYKSLIPSANDPFRNYRYEDDLYESQPLKRLKFSDLMVEENTGETLNTSVEQREVDSEDDSSSQDEIDIDLLINQIDEE